MYWPMHNMHIFMHVIFIKTYSARSHRSTQNFSFWFHKIFHENHVKISKPSISSTKYAVVTIIYLQTFIIIVSKGKLTEQLSTRPTSPGWVTCGICGGQSDINHWTPELNPSAQRCLTRFFTGDFASWTVHFFNICVKTHQQMQQLFIQFINYVW
jgi:hypothetical protein